MQEEGESKEREDVIENPSQIEERQDHIELEVSDCSDTERRHFLFVWKCMSFYTLSFYFISLKENLYQFLK